MKTIYGTLIEMTEYNAEQSGALVYICRNLAGEHSGGPDCWCCPIVSDPRTESLFDLIARIEREQRVQ